jgi:hypothetical protein
MQDQIEMNRKYFKILWNHSIENEPTQYYYDVSEDDRVLRTIHIFPNGLSRADSIVFYDQKYESPGVFSLVEGPFSKLLPTNDSEVSVSEIDRGEFDSRWVKSHKDQSE